MIAVFLEKRLLFSSGVLYGLLGVLGTKVSKKITERMSIDFYKQIQPKRLILKIVGNPLILLYYINRSILFYQNLVK
jgi:hypothetical protein